MTFPSRGILTGIPLVWLSLSGPAAASSDVPAGFHDEQVHADLLYPIGVAFLPDGRMLTWLQRGTVVVSDPHAADAPVPYLAVSDVDHYVERGLLDLALDPAFESNGHFYVFYSHGPTERHRVSRFTDLGGVADPASELVIWESNLPWTSCCHVGGGLDFGPDGYLYVATGDGFSTNAPQDLGRSSGKILRIASDGSIPPDNPFVGVPGALPEVWALGLRNPFRARFGGPGGRLFVAEVGDNDHQTASEDIVLGAPGANYGWPACEGVCDDPQYVDPIHTYPHAGEKACVIGGVVYRGLAYPDAWRGRYFYADYSRGWIRALELDHTAGQVLADAPFAENVGAIVALEVGPKGELYYVVHDEPGAALGSVRRIAYVGPDGGPPHTDGGTAQGDVPR